MNGPRKPTKQTAGKRDQPSTKSRREEANHERTLPGRRSPDNEKQRERIVNEDEQLKVVNNREDNAQSSSPAPDAETHSAATPENGNERIEAGYDNSEVHPRPPKVN